MSDPNYIKNRDEALTEIREAMNERIRRQAMWSRSFIQRSKPLSMPDHLKIHEMFRWPGAVVMAAVDLQDGKSLSEVFSRVSARYQGPARLPATPDDTARSARAKTDGRYSAFEDVLKMLEVAERDFDATYRPLTRDQVEYWQKTHPLREEYLQLAYRENQRHFMKETMAELRSMIEFMRDNPGPMPGVKGPNAKGNKPPRP